MFMLLSMVAIADDEGASRPDATPMFQTLVVFFFTDTATTEIYTLSLHDALPIWCGTTRCSSFRNGGSVGQRVPEDRKSTRLNSSHPSISYAVFCLKKKKLSLLNSLT